MRALAALTLAVVAMAVACGGGASQPIKVAPAVTSAPSAAPAAPGEPAAPKATPGYDYGY